MNAIEFLRFFYSYSRVLSLRELSFLTAISDRTIRTLIAEANEIGLSSGFHIDLIRSIGYQLVIEDLELFEENVLLVKEHTLKTIEFDILNELIHSSYVKIDDLCSRYYVSKGTINKTIKRLKEMLMHYHLQIISKPYFGMRIDGEEHQKRKLIVDIGMDLNLKESYSSSIEEVLIKNDVYFNDMIIHYLDRYLGLILLRVDKSDLLIDIDDLALPKKALDVAQAMFTHIAVLNRLDIKEVNYFANILTMMVILPKDGLEAVITKQMVKFNQIMIEKYHCDLTINKIVYKQFLRHLLYLDKRIISDYQYTNIGFDYYTITSALGYELALELISFIYPNKIVDKEEIGMISLYFGMFLQYAQIRYYNKNKKIAIAVPRYDLTSELFISVFKNEQVNEEIEIFTFMEEEAIRQYNPEIIFSFEPFELSPYLVLHIPLPIFQVCDNGYTKNVAMFMHHESYLKNKQYYELMMGIETYFSKEHYLVHQKINTFPQCLNYLIKHIEQYDLLENAQENLVERLKIAPIFKNGSVGILCPNGHYAKESKIIFLSFKEALMLKNQAPVHILVTVLYKNDDDKKEMLLLLSTLFDKLEHIIDIYEQDDYESFIQYLKNR